LGGFSVFSRKFYFLAGQKVTAMPNIFLPEELIELFCEFAGITNLTESRYSGEKYRGFWHNCLVIFLANRPKWVEPVCTRAERKDEFSQVLETFWVHVNSFENSEKE
jgi:hypothetical protein